jgi:LPS export ABC transporter protein LptC
MQAYRNLVIIALLLLLFGGGWAIWNAGQKVAPPPATSLSSQNSEDSTMVGHTVSFTVTEGAIKKWKIEAAKAVYNKTHTTAQLSDVKGEFYDAAGKPVLQFNAPTGQYTNKNNAVTLSGGVVAKSTQQVGQGGKGGQLNAPTMTWSAKTNRVTASGGVELTFPEGKSTAQVCRFTLDFSNISLEGGVTSSITTP